MASEAHYRCRACQTAFGTREQAWKHVRYAHEDIPRELINGSIMEEVTDEEPLPGPRETSKGEAAPSEALYRCSKCGAGLFTSHDEARRHVESAHAGTSEESIISVARPRRSPILSGDPARRCVVLGSVSLALGLYFLIIAPSEGGAGIANLHRLTLGETFTITGAIFLSAGWLGEPRMRVPGSARPDSAAGDQQEPTTAPR